MGQLGTTVAEVRIDAPVEAVWRVLTDPTYVERLEPRARLVESEGDPGSAGARTRIRLLGTKMEQVVLEADVGERLVLAGSGVDGRRSAEQRAELRQVGGAVVLTWTVTQGAAPAPVRWLSATVCRFALPKWLARVRLEAMSLGAQ